MEPPIMAEHIPALWADYVHPRIIPHVLGKLVGLTVMIFDGKGRFCFPESFRKALSKVPIKVER
jgi:hypothetical protein